MDYWTIFGGTILTRQLIGDKVLLREPFIKLHCYLASSKQAWIKHGMVMRDLRFTSILQ